MADADTITKLCCVCKQNLNFSEFYKDKTGKFGLQSKCKGCSKSAGKQYRIENPDYRKNYQVEHRDRLLAQNAAYYAENWHREHARRKAHRLSNTEYHSQYRAARREEIAAYQRERNRLGINRALAKIWREKNPGVLRSHRSNRRARKLAAGGKMSRDIVSRLLILQKGRCACCTVNLRKTGHHLDHVIPLARGGSNSDSNAQLLCPTCNLRKSAKDPIEFMQSRGLLL
jgi:5-methylcytosine-specific restriction endonuclease McrA